MLEWLIHRDRKTAAWQKIPWHDADFSRRMLRVHLSQVHDLASRRLSIIDQQVDWIHHKVLQAQPATVLDLGCGPGLYIDRLVRWGHTCKGIDISPASIAYARQEHAGEYVLGDVRSVDFGAGYDLVAMIYGELNAFAPDDARRIVEKAHEALRAGGRLLLEVSPYAAVVDLGAQPATWHTAEGGLFSDDPYLCLEESRFEVDRAITDYYVFGSGADEPQRYTTMHQAYTDDEYRHLLGAFRQVTRYPSLTGWTGPGDFMVLVAVK
jgi:SAM-dependent methyltransferase